jgi:hypothetical protein
LKKKKDFDLQLTRPDFELFKKLCKEEMRGRSLSVSGLLHSGSRTISGQTNVTRYVGTGSTVSRKDEQNRFFSVGNRADRVEQRTT